MSLDVKSQLTACQSRTTTHFDDNRTCYFPDNLESVQLLLEKGADPTIATHDGRTPLMIAAYAGCAFIRLSFIYICILCVRVLIGKEGHDTPSCDAPFPPNKTATRTWCASCSATP